MKNKRQKQNTSEGTQHWQNKVNNINQNKTNKKERKQNTLKLIAKWNKNKQIKLKQYKKCTVCVCACVCVCTGIPYIMMLWGSNVYTSIEMPVIVVFVGIVLVPLRKQANKSQNEEFWECKNAFSWVWRAGLAVGLGEGDRKYSLYCKKTLRLGESL